MLHRTAGIPFELGIFTNIEPDHIGPAEHASFEDYIACKGRLFRQCRVGIMNEMCIRDSFLGEERDYGVGMFFFPQDVLKRNQAKKMFESIVRKEGMNFLGWRQVPTVPGVLGHKALEKMPCIEQAFVERPKDVEKGLPFDRRLYVCLLYTSSRAEYTEGQLEKSGIYAG